MAAARKKGDRVAVRTWFAPGQELLGTITRTTLPTYHIQLDMGRPIVIHHTRVRTLDPLEQLADL